MDPNETYHEMVSALSRMDQSMNDHEYMDAASDLFVAVTALNEWLLGGGFLPVAWKSEWTE